MLGDDFEPGETLLAKRESPYQKIELTRLSDGSVALYLDRAIQFVSGDDDRIYHGVLASLPAQMLGGHPGRALILGGGDGLAARNLLSFPNVNSVTMVELDPDMIDFSAEEPVMRRLNRDSIRDPRLNLVVGDARHFLDLVPPGPNFELAIVDFPDPLTPDLEDLFSERLYWKLMNQMNEPRAVIAVQSSSAFSDTEKNVRERLKRVTGTNPVPVRFKGQWMMDGSIVFAGKGMVPELTILPKEWRAEEAPDIVPKKTLSSLF